MAPAQKVTNEALAKPVIEKNKVEDRHPQDKVLEYLKDGVPAEDEFCTQNSSIKNLDHYFIGKRIGQGAYAVVRLGLHRSLN